MRIINKPALITQGYIEGRKKMLEILEAGLDAADPYLNMKKLFRREGNLLYAGNIDYEAAGDPQTGNEVYNLDKIDKVYGE